MIWRVGLEGNNKQTPEECINFWKTKLASGLRSIAIDTETTGLDAHTSHLVTLQIGDSDDQCVINCLSVDVTLFKDLLESSYIIGHNLKFDYKVLKKRGIYLNKLWDTMLAQIVLHNGLDREASLKAITKEYCNVEISKDEQTTFNIHAELTDKQIEYAANDVKYLHEITKKQIDALRTHDLLRTATFECKAVKAIADIEYNGMLLDTPAWLSNAEQNELLLIGVERELDTELIKNAPEYRLKALQQTMFNEEGIDATRLTGVNWRSSKQVLEILHKVYDLHPVDKKSKPSTDANALYSIRKHHFVSILLKHREKAKEISTYGKKFIHKYLNADGRVRTSFWQIVDTGRMSSRAPNVQNIPKYSHRPFFVAPEGYKLIICDFSAQEPRVTAHYCQDDTLLKFFREGDGDIHSMVASQMYSVINGKPTKITKANKDERDVGKITGLKMDYGGSAYTLKNTLETTEQEAQRFIDAYWAGFPNKRQYFDRKIKETFSQGYILIDNVIGRKTFLRDLPKYQSLLSNYKQLTREGLREFAVIKGSISRMAMNYPIQGTSATITKHALILVNERIQPFDARIVNTVHDEIVIECKDTQTKEVAEIAKRAMEEAGAIYCSVPMVVEPKISQKWE